MNNRIYRDEIPRLKFIHAEHRTTIKVACGQAHQIVRDRKTGDDIGIIVLNGNRKRFEYRLYEQDRSYLFLKENPVMNLTAFSGYI